MTHHFFVVSVPDTNIVLGFQWLYMLGIVTIGWHKLEVEFLGPYGKTMLLRGMTSYPPQTVSNHKMESNLRHGYIEWAMELRISEVGGNPKPPHTKIDAILYMYPVVFWDIPPVQPPNRGAGYHQHP